MEGEEHSDHFKGEPTDSPDGRGPGHPLTASSSTCSVSSSTSAAVLSSATFTSSSLAFGSPRSGCCCSVGPVVVRGGEGRRSHPSSGSAPRRGIGKEIFSSTAGKTTTMLITNEHQPPFIDVKDKESQDLSLAPSALPAPLISSHLSPQLPTNQVSFSLSTHTFPSPSLTSSPFLRFRRTFSPSRGGSARKFRSSSGPRGRAGGGWTGEKGRLLALAPSHDTAPVVRGGLGEGGVGFILIRVFLVFG